MIAEYWAKQKKNPSRKSTGGAARKSISKAREESSEVEVAPAPAQKRGRTSLSKPISISEEEEDDRPKTKKTKTTSVSASATKKSVAKSASVTKPATHKKRPKEPTPEAEEDVVEEDEYTDLKKWEREPSWEGIVERIDTVERTSDGELYVYFTLFVYLLVSCPPTLTNTRL